MAVSTYAFCQPSYCDSSNYESNEGPGSSDCCPNKGGSSGYEECKSYLSKSRVYVYNWWTGGLDDSQEDYCSNSYTLNEAFLDCEWGGTDRILSTQKNCNDFDDYGSWVYYCTSSQVRRHRRFYNYGCSDGACRMLSSNWVDDQTVSNSGDSDYCSERKSKGCSLCGHEDYDCDWDSECSGSLECQGGSPDGCCYSYETWDDSRKECCECTSGPCCDGCNYRSSSYVCDSYVSGTDQYKCFGNCLDEDVAKRYQKQYCPGSSSSCSGSKTYIQGYNDENCFSSQFCDGSTSWSSTRPSCETAQCTSGSCCDTRCGEYDYKSSSTVCSQGIDYGCPWGTDIDDDVGKRTVTQYCLGSSASCNGQVNYGGWTVNTYCSVREYCENSQCEAVTCFDKFDCGGEGTSYWFCQNDDTWARYHVGVCHNPGTKGSYCTSYEEDRLYEDCGEDLYGVDYCYGNDLYRDFTDRGCTGHAGGGSGHADCFENETKELVRDCQQGCTNGQCNEDIRINFNLFLNQGWNLISFPLDLIDKTVRNIFNQYSKIFTYDNKWIELDNNSEMNEDLGYWIKVDNGYLLEIEGKELDKNLSLNTGWNLVGYPYLNETNVSEFFNNNLVYSYDQAWSSYIPNRAFNSLQTLNPGYGYWVKSS